MAQKGLKPFLGLNWVAHDYALHPIKFTNRGKENRVYNKKPEIEIERKRRGQFGESKV